MTPAIYPITPDFAAEVGDVDLARATPETIEQIKQAFWRYAVLVFPDQKLTREEHLAFAAAFGPPDRGFVTGQPNRSRVGEGLIDVSNMTSEGEVWDKDSRMRLNRLGDLHWHTDSSFNFIPALTSILYGKAITPVGGFTEFADERAAYEALPPAMKAQLDGLIAEHSWFHSRKRYGLEDFPESMRALNPPAPQALVRTLPQTGRKALYLASHIRRVFGMPEADATKLVDDLLAHATQPQFVYRHRWRLGDVVMWDNRCTLHRGTTYDDVRWRRDLQRATVLDVGNSAVEEGLELPVEAVVETA